MPVLVRKIIFDMIPKKSPFFVRPIVSRVFAQVNKLLVDPEIKKHLTMVRGTFYDEQGKKFDFDVIKFRLKHISKNQNLFSLRAGKSQLSVIQFNLKQTTIIVGDSLSRPQIIRWLFPWKQLLQCHPIELVQRSKNMLRSSKRGM